MPPKSLFVNLKRVSKGSIRQQASINAHLLRRLDFVLQAVQSSLERFQLKNRMILEASRATVPVYGVLQFYFSIAFLGYEVIALE